MKSGRSRPLPPLHVIVSDEVASGPGFLRLATEMFGACGSGLALHLRVREFSGRRLQELATDLAGRAEVVGGWCVVNERLDVAMVADAQGVQLGGGALGVRKARALLASGLAFGLASGVAIGASVHDEWEAEERAREGANYLVAGMIYPSRSHPGRQPAGVSLITRCAGAGLPVVAIGGITGVRVPEIVEAGASGVAVLRALWNSTDPVAEACHLIEAIRAAGEAAAGE